MDPIELTVGFGLAALLVGIAGYFAYRQQHTLGELRHDANLSAEDRRYLRRQVARRLVSSALLIVLAGFLVGWFFLWPGAENLRPPEPADDLPESAKESLRLLTYYVIGGLLVFFAVLALALFDLLATARFGARHRRQLEDDRRAALQEEVERLHHDRHRLNGEGHL